MAAWLAAMNTLQRTFAYIAIAGTVALLLQTLLMLFGVGQDDDGELPDTSGLSDGADGGDLDFDADMDGDFDADAACAADHAFEGDRDGFDDAIDGSLRLFTLRGLIAFCCIMGWSGLVLLKGGMPGLIAITLAVGMGVLAMVLMALAIRQMMRLETTGNVDVRNAIGRTATVYITIPAAKTGTGKVDMLLQQRYVELDAATEALSPIKPGTEVLVSAVANGTLIVEPIVEG